jgi:cytochrome c oxidase assembly protein subunit 15
MATRTRSIFEEVSAAQAPTAGAIDRGRRDGRLLTRAWLVALFALVVVMILVGGLTRLTDSGLSITEWDLVTGTLPPLSAEAWQREFDLYRASSQYQEINRGMSLAEFQGIYWWEWGHRALGRVIGLVWAVGFAALLLTRRMPQGWTPRALLVGVLIGLQGAIGWWMVRSGLEEGMISVASTRLAVHLGLAFVILGLIAWQVMALSRPQTALLVARRGAEARLWAGPLASCTFCSFRSSWARSSPASTRGGPIRPGPTWLGASFRRTRSSSLLGGATSWRTPGSCSSSTA